MMLQCEHITLFFQKIALITIGFIVGSFENFGSFEKVCLKKKTKKFKRFSSRRRQESTRE